MSSGCSGGDNATWIYCGNSSDGSAPTGFSITLADGNDVLYANLYGTENACCAPVDLPVVADGGIGNDTLTGGSSTDTLDGGFGSDTINGGGGTDTASYAGRSDGVTVNLAAGGPDDGSQSDGNPGARDNINNTDIEQVVGSDGADTITGAGLTRPLTFEGRGGGDSLSGGSAPNVLRGEGGNDTLSGGSDPDQLDGGDGGDTINGLGAADVVRGGSGFDNIEARDGIADDVDCGPDDDSAFTDSVDTRVNCDPVQTTTDGGTGTTTTTTTSPPPPTLARIVIQPVLSAISGRRATLVRQLVVKSVDAGSLLTVKCRTKAARRCPGTRDFTKRKASGNVRVRSFERKSLAVGAKLEVRATQSGMVGAVKVLTMRKGKKPSLTTRCLPPGATRPTTC